MEGVKYVLLVDVGLSHCHNDYKPSSLEECPLISEVSSTRYNIKLSGGHASENCVIVSEVISLFRPSNT